MLRLLGAGGFGDVYLGEHIHLSTQAAIKVLQARLARDDMQSFLQEARTVARLEHPNIIRILEFGVDPSDQYALSGNDLRSQWDDSPALSARESGSSGEIVTYVRQIASALAYAHSQRFIHRDVKLENFLLGRNNEVLLSDFGTALLAQSSHAQSTKDVIGTAAYMSPEQLQGKPVPASDQYSLGIVVYEWLSGECPSQGNFMELYSQHLNVSPVPLHQKVPGISQDIAQVVQRALAKDVRYRFPDIQAFAEALTQACEPTMRMAPLPANFQPSGPLQARPSQPPAASSFPSQPTTPPATLSSAETFPLPSSAPLAPPLVDQANINTEASSGQGWFSPPVSGPAPTPAPAPAYQSPAAVSPAISGQSANLNSTPPQKRRTSSKKVIGLIGTVAVALLLIIIVAATVLPRFPFSAQTGGNSNQPGTTNGGGSLGGSTSVNPTSTPSPISTPSPTPLAAGDLIYQATFDPTDFGNWSGDNSQQWKLVGNGELGSDGTGDGQSNGGFIIWYQHEMPAQNYAVEAKIQFVRNTDNTASYLDNYYEFGIMVRGDGNKAGYEAGMKAGNTSYSRCSQGAFISSVQDDNGTQDCTPTYLKQVAYTLDNTVHTYRVEVRGNSIQLFLDNQTQPLLSTTDNTYLQAGRVGLRSVYADINVLSFKVTAL